MTSSGQGFFSNILTTVQNAVSGVNNLAQILGQATVNSSSLQVTIKSTIFLTSTSITSSFGTVTTVNTSIGLTGGPITTAGTIAVSLSNLTTSLTSDNALTLNAYVDGPTLAQGTSGVWFASGAVTVLDTVSAAQYSVKLWDGTTVIASDRFTTVQANTSMATTVSGFLTNPASNIRISVNANSSSSALKFNVSGNSKDCTLSAMRIG